MDKSWKVVLAFLGVFIAGAVFGGFFALRINKAAAQRKAPAPPQMFGLALMRRFADRLELTPEQREKLRPIIENASGDLRRNLRETAFTLQHLQQDIRKELTPEQQKKLDALEAQQRERLREDRSLRMDNNLAPRRREFQPDQPAPAPKN